VLLVVVLAVSVFVMHTLGHRDSAPGPTAGAPGALSHTAPMPKAAPARGEHGHASGAAVAMAGHVPQPPHAAHGAAGHHPESPATGTSGLGTHPLSVCVAMLGSMLLAALVRRLLADRRRTRTPYEMVAPAAVVRRLPPVPLPAPSLTRLSVLRI
jgi:hypothetical protein